jgi:hypothetical protein
MAYQGLNVEGAPLVRVMPQYTPVNTAIDLSGIGRGIEQGMGLVNQATQMRRARDLMLEEQSRRPVRDLVAEAQLAGARRNIAEAGMPIEMIADTAYENIPGVGIVSKETISSIDPITGNKTYRDRTSKLIETEAQRNQRISNEKKQFRPMSTVVKNKDGTFKTVVYSVTPGEEGKQLFDIQDTAVTGGYTEPDYNAGPNRIIPGPNGNISVPTRVSNITGQQEIFNINTGQWGPDTGTVVPDKNNDTMWEDTLKWNAYKSSEVRAGRPPLSMAEWKATINKPENISQYVKPAPAQPEPTRIRVDASSVYGTP